MQVHPMQRVTLAVTDKTMRTMLAEANALQSRGQCPCLCAIALTIWLHAQPEAQREAIYQEIASEVCDE